MQPVVLVCTSGTAGANWFPAIIEAQESGVPLLAITADRPPEMRACASGQTIDQQNLFGDHVNFFHELAVPELSDLRLRYLRQTLAHAVGRTRWPFAGPVHLNAPFRDPLPPLADDGAAEKFSATVEWDNFFSHLAPPAAAQSLAPVPPLGTDVHGVIVAGPDAHLDVAAVGEIARRLGWPVLTDGLSPLRNFSATVPHLVTCYDAILRSPATAERLRPEIVLALGDWPASKVLRAWLDASGATVWQASPHAGNRDALHARARALHVSLPLLAASLPAAAEPNGYERLWAALERKARAALDARLATESALFEGKAAWLLAQHLPAETSLAIASSMPVRDVEYFWPPNDRQARPFASRGANGIDGTLSTALGVAHDCGRPAVLLCGDLALLHDSNGFLLRPKFRGSLTIVLINNRGGGIFGHLPIAAFDPPFEEFFATPQEADFALLCAAHGAEHVPVRDWPHFTALVSALPASGLRVLELRTDRKHDAAWRQSAFAEIAAAL